VLGAIARELGRPVVLVTRGGKPDVADPRVRLLYDLGDLRIWAFGAS